MRHGNIRLGFKKRFLEPVAGGRFIVFGHSAPTRAVATDAEFTYPANTMSNIRVVARAPSGRMVMMPSNGNLYYSDDEGITWTITHVVADFGWSSITQIQRVVLYWHPDHNCFYASPGTLSRMARSTDGITWTNMQYTAVSGFVGPFRGPGTRLFAVYLTNDNMIYSDDYGASWTQVDDAVPIQGVTKGTFIPSTGRIILPSLNASNTPALAFSDDNGATWSSRTLPGTSGNSLYGAFYCEDVDTVFITENVSSLSRLYYSTDHGDTWSYVDFPESTGLRGVASSPSGVIGIGGLSNSYTVTSLNPLTYTVTNTGSSAFDIVWSPTANG